MLLGVAFVCPAFLNVFEQTCMRNCVECSAGNDRDCWCVHWFRVRGDVAKKFFRLREPLVPHFSASQRHVRDDTRKHVRQVGILFMRMSPS